MSIEERIAQNKRRQEIERQEMLRRMGGTQRSEPSSRPAERKRSDADQPMMSMDERIARNRQKQE